MCVYKQYQDEVFFGLKSIIACTHVCTRIAQSYYLGKWLTDMENSSTGGRKWEDVINQSLLLYLIFIGVYLVTVGLRALYQAMTAIQGSKVSKMYIMHISFKRTSTLITSIHGFCIVNDKVLHERLAASVLQAPSHWLDATPTGRIINRFSQDVSTLVCSCVKLRTISYLT